MEIVWVYIKNRMLTKELPGKKQRNTKENVYGCCEGGHAGRGRKDADAEDRCRGQGEVETYDQGNPSLYNSRMVSYGEPSRDKPKKY